MYKYLITLTATLGATFMLAGSAHAETKAAAASAPTPPPKVHEVQPGDSLSVIATAEGLETWRPLWDANADLTDPNYIEVGQKIVVPSAPVPERPLPDAGVATATVTTPSSVVNTPRTKVQAGAPVYGGGGSDLMARIRAREAGGNYATNTGNGYYGAYQFSLGTWQSVGGSGLPSSASAAEQDMRAQMLYDRRGCSPWPNTCR
jgi:hypothetical protein